METVIFALNAVLPIVALIALGYVLKKIGFLTEEFIAVGNRLCFRVLIPIMLFINVYKVESLSTLEIYPAVYAVAGIIGAALLGVILAAIFIKDRKQKSAVAQCVVRSNYAIIGIPLAVMMVGEEAEITASLLSVFVVPVFNVAAVIILSAYDNEGLNFKQTVKKTILGILQNPLIHGVILGLIVVGIRTLFGLPAILNLEITDPSIIGQSSENPLYFLYTALNYISMATTPVALIVLGGQFEFKTFKKDLKPIIVATIGRTVLVPAIFLTIAVLLGFKGASIAALVAVFASPVAVASATMAKEMNSDGELATSLVVSTTVFSSITLILVVIILKALAVI